MTSPLFEKLELRGLTLSNRIIVAPMCQYSGSSGSPTDWHLIHLGQLAQSGAGLLIFEATAVEPDPSVLGRLDVDSWSGAIGELRLPPATAENINDWMEAQAGWVNSTLAALNFLVNATHEQILTAEAGVDAMVRQEAPVEAAPGTSCVRKDYALLLEGSERPRQRKLGWWDRFQTADGLVPDLARSIVALCIVGSVIWAGASLDFEPFNPAPTGATPFADTWGTDFSNY